MARSIASRTRQARSKVAGLSEQAITRDEPQLTKPSAEGFALVSRSKVTAATPARASPCAACAALMLALSISTFGVSAMRCRAASNSTVLILAGGRAGLGDALPAASLAQ